GRHAGQGRAQPAVPALRLPGRRRPPELRGCWVERGGALRSLPAGRAHGAGSGARPRPGRAAAARSRSTRPDDLTRGRTPRALRPARQLHRRACRGGRTLFMRPLVLASTAAAALLAPLCAQADDDAPTVEAVVVTAPAAVANLSDVPNTTSGITAAEIE